MKFCQCTAPDGSAVYVSSEMIISSAPTGVRVGGSLIRSSVGTQEVRELPAEVVKALEEASA